MEFLDMIPDWVSIILAAVGGFAMVATATPNESDNKLVDKVYKFINVLGANVGKAANDMKDAKPK